MKIFIFSLYSIFVANLLIAQTPQSNLEKYWYYRQRFNDYFIIPCKTDECKERGEGTIISIRNAYSEDFINF